MLDVRERPDGICYAIRASDSRGGSLGIHATWRGRSGGCRCSVGLNNEIPAGKRDNMHLQRSGLSVDAGGKWYCIRSQPRHEHIAAANLRRNHQLEVFNPRIRFKRATRRGPVWVTEPLFPSYLFARFELSALLPKVQHAFGVAGVVRFGTFWPAVSDAVIRELLSAVGEEETRIIEDPLPEGGEVQILGGAFDGFRAIVTRVLPARNRVAVLLDFLGRQTMVELDRGAVVAPAEWCAVRGGFAAAV